MADVTVTFTITQAQADALPLEPDVTRLNEDGEMEVIQPAETVNEYACRLVCDTANNQIKAKRQQEFNALTDAQKEAAIAAVKS